MSDPAQRDPRAAWHAFCEDLKQAGDALFRAGRPDDALTDAEGLRHLTRLLRIGIERGVEFGDPDFPTLHRIVDETKKFGCDNPDTIYQMAGLRGTQRYRISGTRGTVDYLSFTTSKGSYAGERRTVPTGFLDSNALAVDPDGRFTIDLGNERSGANWLPMEPETSGLSIRQTFLDRRREVAADLTIERIDDGARPTPLTWDQATAGLRTASGFTVYAATTFTDWTHSYLPHPNALPPADQAKCLAAGGDPNIYFYRSFWTLEPDQALVVRIPRVPACDTWNLQVDNFWQESMDHRRFTSHTNKGLATYDADGGMTAVIAHRDPGVPNWLDTADHRFGHFAMRWIRADEHVDPVTQACAFDDVRATIAALKG